MVTKHVYTKLINRIAESVNLQGKWANHIHNELQNTEKWFSHIYKITIDNVLRSFQYKLLHRIIFFNDKLFLFGITNNDLCDACNAETDSIEHRLWLCPRTQLIWQNIIQWYNRLYNTNVHITYENIVSNICGDGTTILEFIILCTKYHVYKTFLNKNMIPNVYTLIKEILYLEKIEKDIAYKKGKLAIHCKKWGILATCT